jgi:hypothetical protein
VYWKQDDERALRIVSEGAKLYLRQTGEGRIELLPQAEKQFQLSEFPVTLAFEESGLSMEQPGLEKPNRFERVTAFHPTPAQLNQYAGAYASAEIDPIYRIRVERRRVSAEAV